MPEKKRFTRYVFSKYGIIALLTSIIISVYVGIILCPTGMCRASFWVGNFLVLFAVVISVISITQRIIVRKVRDLNSYLNQMWVEKKAFNALQADDEIGPLVRSYQSMSRQLHRRIEMEQLIAEVSKKFTTAKDEEFQNVVNDSLRNLGVFLEVDRSYLLLFDESKIKLFPFALWSRSGVSSRIFSDDGISKFDIPWLLSTFSLVGTVAPVSLDDFPEESVNERKLWCEGTTKSHSVVFQSLKIKGELIGFIGCELLISDHPWNQAELHLLVMFAEITSSSIERFKTERLMKIQNQQLLQAQKMETVGHLAGGIAHDFNNILAGIVSLSSVFRMDHHEDESISRDMFMPFLDTVQEAGERATKVVQQLLSLSRKQEYNFAVIDLNRVVKQASEMVATSFEKTINITIDLCDGHALTKADAIQIEQVVLNFMMNSAHAMTVMRKANEIHGGSLTIKNEIVMVDKLFRKKHPAAFEQAYWKLTISDTGVGIPRENYAKIFDPFFTTKEKGIGTGLGLSMIYRIVQEHYGFVEFESEVGVGTTFYIYFPVTNEEVEENSLVSSSNIKSVEFASAKILVVDDEPVLRKIAARILESAGHTVLLAENGGEAVDIFEEQGNSIDVVILDLVMPILGGRETYLELIKIRPDIPVIISSGFRKDERIDELIELGVAGFLQKPYTVEQMKDVIREVLSKRY